MIVIIYQYFILKYLKSISNFQMNSIFILFIYELLTFLKYDRSQLERHKLYI